MRPDDFPCLIYEGAIYRSAHGVLGLLLFVLGVHLVRQASLEKNVNLAGLSSIGKHFWPQVV